MEIDTSMRYHMPKSSNSSHRPFFTLDYNNDAEYEYPMLKQTREIDMNFWLS